MKLLTYENLATIFTEVKKFVNGKIEDVVGGAPETLDTLKEISEALGNDANLAATLTTEIGKKVDTTTFEAKNTQLLNTCNNLEEELTSQKQTVGNIEGQLPARHEFTVTLETEGYDGTGVLTGNDNALSVGDKVNLTFPTGEVGKFVVVGHWGDEAVLLGKTAQGLSVLVCNQNGTISALSLSGLVGEVDSLKTAMAKAQPVVRELVLTFTGEDYRSSWKCHTPISADAGVKVGDIFKLRWEGQEWYQECVVDAVDERFAYTTTYQAEGVLRVVIPFGKEYCYVYYLDNFHALREMRLELAEAQPKERDFAMSDTHLSGQRACLTPISADEGVKVGDIFNVYIDGSGNPAQQCVVYGISGSDAYMMGADDGATIRITVQMNGADSCYVEYLDNSKVEAAVESALGLIEEVSESEITSAATAAWNATE